MPEVEMEIIDEQIHPCKGCEDYAPENGCKSNGGCGAQAKLKDLIMEVFNIRPSTANKCIEILDDIKAIIERETRTDKEKRMSELKLKPCPFCGGEAIMQQHRVNGDDRFTETWIFCNDCLGQTRQYLSAKRAIEAWNRRTKNE